MREFKKHNLFMISQELIQTFCAKNFFNKILLRVTDPDLKKKVKEQKLVSVNLGCEFAILWSAIVAIEAVYFDLDPE